MNLVQLRKWCTVRRLKSLVAKLAVPPRAGTPKLGVETLESRLALSTVHWTGAEGTSNWHDQGNWDTNAVPGVADDVVIEVINPEDSADVVISSADVSVKSINVNFGGKLSINARTVTTTIGLNANAFGTLEYNTGADIVGDVAIIDGTLALNDTHAETFDLVGRAHLQATEIGVNQTLNLWGYDSPGMYIPGLLNAADLTNKGTIQTFGAETHFDLNSLTNEGTIDATSGKLDLVNTVLTNTGTFTASNVSGGTVNQNAGSASFNGGQEGVNITLNDGTLNLGGGYFHNADFAYLGGSLANTNPDYYFNTVDLTLGEDAGAMSFTVLGASTLTGDIAADQTVTIKNGALTTAGDLTNNGTMTLGGTAPVGWWDTFDTTGILAVNGGAGTFTNNGTVNVVSGEVQQATVVPGNALQATLLNNGTVSVDGTSLAVGVAGVSGSHVNNDTISLANDGSIVFYGAGGTNAGTGLIVGTGTLDVQNLGSYVNQGSIDETVSVLETVNNDTSPPTITGATIAAGVIQVTFADDFGMDEATVTNLANYTLLASGDDGTFADNNELDVGSYIEGIVLNNGVATITLANVPVNGERYQLTIDGPTDSSGNSLAAPFVFEFSALSTVAHNAVFTGGSSNWNDAANWAGGVVPGPDDTVYIADPNTTVLIDGVDVTIKELHLAGNLTLENGGTLTLLSGDSVIDGNLSITNGAVNVGAVVQSEAVVSDVESGPTFTIAGTAMVDGATLSAGAGGQIKLLGATTFGAIVGAVNVTADGAGSLVDLTGVTSLTSAAHFSATNGGTIRLPNLSETNSASPTSVEVDSEPLFSFTSTGECSLIDLSGLATITGSFGLTEGGTIVVGDAVTFENAEVLIGAGSDLKCAMATLEGGTTLKGDGTLTGSVNNAAGSVNVGASPGHLTIVGDYTQGVDGTLVEEVGGTTQGISYDWLEVTGMATLAGTLHITFYDNFEPTYGNTFSILTAGSLGGAFATVTGANYGALALDVSYETGSLPNVIGGEGGPPPSSAAVVLTAIALPVESPPLLESDLTASAVGTTGTPIEGEALTVTWTVTNSGSGGAAGPWQEQVYLSQDDTVGDDTLLGTFFYSAPLDENESVNRSESVTLPSGVTGAYHLIVVIDSASEVTESAENNNSDVSSAIEIAAAVPAKLGVSDISVTDTTPDRGSTLTVNWKLHNLGNIPTGPLSVNHALYLSKDQTVGAGDYLLGSDLALYAGSLDGDSTSAELSAEIMLPDDVHGIYYLLIVPDAEGVSGLEHESGAVSVSVQVSTLSGYVFDDTDDDGNWDSGENGIEGRTVYLDADDNGSLDEGETTTLTNEAGQYVFTGLDDSDVVVRQIVPEHWRQTQPANDAGYPVDSTAELDLDTLLFGTKETDHTAPITNVTALPTTQSSLSFEVHWTGQDEVGGSGLAFYNVFVAVDDNKFMQWQTKTSESSATYTGEFGHTYKFYSVGVDQAGNVEAAPLTPDATTNLVATAPPVLAINTGMSAVEGLLTKITAAQLKATDADTSAAHLTLTLGAVPLHGTLLKNGVALTSGGTFTQDDINLSRIRYQHDGSESTTDSFSFVVTDASNNALPEATFALTILPRNDAPVLNGGNRTLSATAEDTPTPGQTIAGIVGDSITDPDAGAVEGVAIIGLSGNGNWQYSLDNGSSWHNVGPVASNSGRLLRASDQIRFVPAANSSGTASFTYRAWDQTSGAACGLTTFPGGTGAATAFSSRSVSATVQITAANDAPTLTNLATTMTDVPRNTANPAGNTVASIVGSSITDPDPAARKGIAITGLTGTEKGVWQYALAGSATWTTIGALSDSAALTLRDTDKIRFVPNADQRGKVTFTYRGWDQTSGSPGGYGNPGVGSGGTTAFSAEVATCTLMITPPNFPPVLTPGLVQPLTPVAEDTTNPGGNPVSAILGSAVTDGDAVDPQGIAVVGLTGSANGTWQYSLNGGVTWTDFGAVHHGAARLLRPTDWVRFTPHANFSGAAGGLTFRAWDQTTGTPGGTANLSVLGSTGGDTAFSEATATSEINITPINDAPILSVHSPNLLSGPSGSLVANLLGATMSDVDPAPKQGIAVVGLGNAMDGTWQYSINGGVTWLDFGAVYRSRGRLLRPENRVRFVPKSYFTGPAKMTYHGWDQTSGTPGGTVNLLSPSAVGGTTAYSVQTQIATWSI